MNNLKAIDLTYGAVFVCLMAIGANITVWFPFLAIPIGGATVPLSLQTFFAILAGLILGRKLGSISMFVYLLVGIVGVPVFAQMKAGLFELISPTGGFLFSFVLVAFLTGWISDRMNKPTMITYSIAALIGLVANYLIGVSYMYIAMNTWLDLPISYLVAWSGMIPFLIKDTALSCLAAIFTIQLAKRLNLNWKTA